jgi:hypothetical protein
MGVDMLKQDTTLGPVAVMFGGAAVQLAATVAVIGSSLAERALLHKAGEVLRNDAGSMRTTPSEQEVTQALAHLSDLNGGVAVPTVQDAAVRATNAQERAEAIVALCRQGILSQGEERRQG